MNKASIETLHSIHEVLARDHLRVLQSGEATAADRAAAAKFLKDNGVEQAALPGTPLRNLADSLPFAGSDTYTQ